MAEAQLKTVPPTNKKTKPKSGGGDKKPRAARKDYGFAKDATIVLAAEEKTYRGQRKEWFEKLKASNGKTVEHFLNANQGKDPPRGWLRFFVEDGAATLKSAVK